MLVNYEKKVVFLHNPKCAGMSISKALEEVGYVNLVNDPGWPHNTTYDGIDLNDYLVVTTYREPLQRYMSYYRYLLKHERYTGTFAEFISTGPRLPLQKEFLEKAHIVQPYHEARYVAKMLGGELKTKSNVTIDNFHNVNYDCDMLSFIYREREDIKYLDQRGLLK